MLICVQLKSRGSNVVLDRTDFHYMDENSSSKYLLCKAKKKKVIHEGE